MKYYAIASLLMFFIVKSTIYILTLTSKRGYATDYSRVLTIVLPIMSLFMYAGCYYVLSNSLAGFVSTVIVAWILLIVAIIIVRHLRVAFIFVTSSDSYENYVMAKNIVNHLNNIDSDIVTDDNIGMSKSIKISYDTHKFSRDNMADLVTREYEHHGIAKRRYHVSLHALMVHMCELIFDISFLINICML